ncbi:hypothetical protein JVT61DRAFT_12614 [Boletus reticuloceps]|uniref:Uncharacterized protein n=1 Tax=Boletus reticuloceps TaxID=495285 RepID=A0A8I3A405_9AGAM|nr:hypothetical protein JVT61DRAFT_12614 [Boletus reticuloceps]
MLAISFSFLAVPGVVNQNSGTSTIQIIICCSIVSTVASIIFSFTFCVHSWLPDVWCFHGDVTFMRRADIGYDHALAQSNEDGNGMPYRHEVFPCPSYMVVRY